MKCSGELLQPKKGQAAVVTSWHCTVQTHCLLRTREVWKAATPPEKSIPTSHLSQEPQEFTRLFSFRGKEQGGKTETLWILWLYTSSVGQGKPLSEPKMWMFVCKSVCVWVCVRVCVNVILTAAACHSFPARQKKIEEKEWIFFPIFFLQQILPPLWSLKTKGGVK